MTISTNKATTDATNPITAGGNISPVPATATNVTIIVKNFSGGLMTNASTPLDSVTGRYLYTIDPSGLSCGWYAGTYTIAASAVISGQLYNASTTFTYLPGPAGASSSSSSTSCSTPCYSCDFGSADWALTTKPVLAQIGGDLNVTYANNLAVASTGLVYSVVHNQLGQTVGYVVVTMRLDAGQTGSAYLPVWFDFGPGNYTVSIFVTSPAGIAMSNSTSVAYDR